MPLKTRKTIKVILYIILAAAVLLIAVITSVYLGAFGRLHSKEELINYKNAIASEVYSGDGELIGKFFSENRTNISYPQIPIHLINALIATEDVRFFEHRGIDSRSILRVLIKSVLLGKRNSGGGSTITQQLAKNMYGRRDFGLLTMIVNKIKEGFLASRLEKSLSKEEILTLYLNTVSFGENVYGIGVAARQYFNKNVNDLKIEESAVLTGMLKANTYYNLRLNPENAKRRRNVVLKQMEKYGYLNPSEADSLSGLPLKQDTTVTDTEKIADYFLVNVRNETEQILEKIEAATGNRWNVEEDGLTIVTTLNFQLQKYAVRSFRDHLSVMQKKLDNQYRSPSGKKLIREIAEGEISRSDLKGRAGKIIVQEIFDWDGIYTDSVSVADSLEMAIKTLHAGLLAIDPSNGAVRSWVGGIDFKTQPYDQILAQRQLGSVFKPIIYATALEEGMDPCRYLDNDSVVLSDYEDWSPVNYDHTYGGKYSFAGALVHSMNIPTLNLFLELGFEKIDSMWRKLGFAFPIFNHPSLALGTAEGSIREVAEAYAAFANGGYRIVSKSVELIKSPDGEVIYHNEFNETKDRIITDRSVVLLSAILQKAIREGTGASLGSVFGVNMPLAGKTGTTQDHADAWFAAYNPGLVMVTRVGASIPSVHFNNGSEGSGSALALPLVALTLKKIQSDPKLRASFIKAFPLLPEELSGALECPDFKENNLFDQFFDIFRRDRKIPDRKVVRPERRRKSFFRRIFGNEQHR
jgi:penicillin-binding protein 1A